jgi:dTDP-4-dehydrorhamnose 3,5-epimerase-like enzyme
LGRAVRGADPDRRRLFVIFAETELKGVFVVEVDKLVDARGFFARVWCEQELRGQDLNPRIAQCSISFNHKRGTLRECTTRSRRTKRQSWFVVRPGRFTTSFSIYD